jgi:N6-adenosine-specific RNA methylase IME4
MGRLRDIGRPRHGPKFPERYDIILADSPWEYGQYIVGNRSPENHYPCMSTDDICALHVGGKPVKDIAAKDAALFLWTTNAHLEEAITRVIPEWDFIYKTNLVWTKDKFGLGYYFRTQHETLLLATIGKFRAPKPGNRPPSVIEAPRRRHSQKPDEVYEAIEQMYPDPGLAKLELFARNRRSGWFSWGDELGNEIRGNTSKLFAAA